MGRHCLVSPCVLCGLIPLRPSCPLPSLTYGSVALGIPDSLGNALLATELCDSSVDCHTSHDRDNSVSLLASIYIEDCLESASHNSYFFVRCKIKL